MSSEVPIAKSGLVDLKVSSGLSGTAAICTPSANFNPAVKEVIASIAQHTKKRELKSDAPIFTPAAKEFVPITLADTPLTSTNHVIQVTAVPPPVLGYPAFQPQYLPNQQYQSKQQKQYPQSVTNGSYYSATPVPVVGQRFQPYYSPATGPIPFIGPNALLPTPIGYLPSQPPPVPILPKGMQFIAPSTTNAPTTTAAPFAMPNPANNSTARGVIAIPTNVTGGPTPPATKQSKKQQKQQKKNGQQPAQPQQQPESQPPTESRLLAPTVEVATSVVSPGPLPNKPVGPKKAPLVKSPPIPHNKSVDVPAGGGTDSTADAPATKTPTNLKPPRPFKQKKNQQPQPEHQDQPDVESTPEPSSSTTQTSTTSAASNMTKQQKKWKAKNEAKANAANPSTTDPQHQSNKQPNVRKLFAAAPRESDLSMKLYHPPTTASFITLAPPLPPTAVNTTAASTVNSSPSKPSLDDQTKKTQASTLFNLMQSFGGGASNSKSKSKQQQAIPNNDKTEQVRNKEQPQQHQPVNKKGGEQKKEGFKKDKKADKQSNQSFAQDLNKIDLSALINQSHKEHIKQKQLQQPTAQTKDDHSELVPDLKKLDDLLAAKQAEPKYEVGPPVRVPTPSPAEQFRQLYDSTKEGEAQLTALLNHQHQSSSGASFSNESRARIISLRAELRGTYLKLLTEFSSKFSVQKNIVHKLWMNVYKEMEAMLNQCKEKEVEKQSKVTSAPPAPSSYAAAAGFNLFSAEAEEEELAFRMRLQTMIDTNFEMFDRLSSNINGKYSVFSVSNPTVDSTSSKVHSSDAVFAAKQLLSSLCVCLGDLDRYRTQYLSIDTAHADWSRCIFFYTRALLLDPASSLAGKSHNQLAVVASYTVGLDGHKGTTLFESLYHYTRALTTPINPFPARENVLNLYEENRVFADDIMRKIQANLATTNISDLSVMLCLFIRLLSILDTHIGMESFDRVFKVGLTEKLKSIINYDWFTQHGQQRRLTDIIVLKMLVLSMNMVEHYLSQDAEVASGNSLAGRQANVLANLSKANTSAATVAKNAIKTEFLNAAATVTPISPFPFALSSDSLQAISILHELLGIIVRIPALISKGSEPIAFFTNQPIPFLPGLTLAFGWIRAKWPWILTQPELLHDEMSIAVKPCEYVRTGLAQLANMLEPIVASNATIPPSTASLLELEGFKPLIECNFWPAAKADLSLVDTVQYQAQSLVTFAKQILYAHPITNRLSALPPPPSALTPAEVEHLKKQQEAWIQKRANLSTDPQPVVVARKKRASKQGNRRPLFDASAYMENHESSEDTSAEQSQDAEEAVIARIQELGVDGAILDESALGMGGPAIRMKQPTSALESMVSNHNLGLSPSTTPVATPAPTSSSVTVTSPFSLGSSKPLLVLDAPNIAMSHGKHQIFSVRGIEIVIEFFTRRGFRVLAFLPDSYLDYGKVGEMRRAVKAGFEVKKTAIPDNIGLLHTWRKEGLLVTTPAADYDDTYVVDYAMHHENALIVSNDKYRDHAQLHASASFTRKDMLNWLRDHVISFTFVGDNWFQNPDWRFDSEIGLRKIHKQPGGGQGQTSGNNAGGHHHQHHHYGHHHHGQHHSHQQYQHHGNQQPIPR